MRVGRRCHVGDRNDLERLRREHDEQHIDRGPNDLEHVEQQQRVD
jgi:hypothetical protein